MAFQRPLIAPTANPLLEQALRQKLQRRSETTGSLGELEPLAVQLGLMQNSLKPGFDAPHIVVFAADHGLAVEGIGAVESRSTGELVQLLLNQRLPLAVFARTHGLNLCVVDSGLADPGIPHPRLLARKIAHGTRNARSGWAMSPDQAEAAVRAGTEIAAALPGNAVACAGIGVGSHESAALVLSRLSGADLASLVSIEPAGQGQGQEGQGQGQGHLFMVLQAAHARHKDVIDPLRVVAAFGGFEMAMMVGLMLGAASRRHLLLLDGMSACAALMVASRLAPAVSDYCIHCRSHSHRGLDEALALFGASALLELGIESTDGTGATLAWPLVRSAAALLTEVADGDDAGPTRPGPLTP